jgi:hypothetical protein
MFKDEKYPLLTKAAGQMPEETSFEVWKGSGEWPNTLRVWTVRGRLGNEPFKFDFFDEREAVRYLSTLLADRIGGAKERAESAGRLLASAQADMIDNARARGAMIALLVDSSGDHSGHGGIQINVDQGDLPNDVAYEIVDEAAQMIADKFTSAKAAIEASGGQPRAAVVEIKTEATLP